MSALEASLETAIFKMVSLGELTRTRVGSTAKALH
jgi:hypothetical protein